MKKMNIGISIFAVKDAHLWSNGLNMNLAFLVLLLQASPDVGKVYLLNGGDHDAIPEALQFDQIDAPLVKPADVTYELDVVIEMGAQLPTEWLKRMSALGVKLISFLVGHTYAGNAEGPIFDRNSGQMFNDVPWDEVWTLPQYMKSCAPMLRTITRAPVLSMPHIWSPMFLQKQVDEYSAQGAHFGFVPHVAGESPRAWRVTMFEPNISVVKTCFIPMLVCDQAYRLNPQAIGLMMVLNSFGMKDHLTFNRFALNMQLTKDSKATYEPRLSFADCMMNHHMDAVISHQWENEQNYLYYDTLYGNYPLIHNSAWLHRAGVGFYYPEFEAKIGGEQLLHAWAQDAGFWQDYQRHNQGFLATLHPTLDSNIQIFTQQLKALVNGGAA
ncbi:MAG: DUF2827 domain-containing protein [Formosimonas sp.]